METAHELSSGTEPRAAAGTGAMVERADATVAGVVSRHLARFARGLLGESGTAALSRPDVWRLATLR